VKRREFITLVGGAAVAWPMAARAQKAPARIGFLASGAATSASSAYLVAAIKQGLRDNSLIEGRDYVLDTRFAGGNYVRFPELARELAQVNVSVILANTIVSVRAAQRLTPPVPVVMTSINDPVGAGLIASLARPGGHTTGMANLNQDVTPKLVEHLRAVLPKATVIAALLNPSNPTNPVFLDNLRTQAGPIGITVLPFEMKSPSELDNAFSEIVARRPDALQIISDSGTLDMMDQIAAKALLHRLPTCATDAEYPLFGGFMAYGAPRSQLFVRSAYYVKKILEGAKPGDLPVEQPTRVELWVNLKTAKALDISIPSTVLAVADRVIE
jgi:ABC-type uncharacterized transport system substrate-binding protein